MTKATDIFGDTGEVIERDATPEEIAAQTAVQQEFLANEAIRENLKFAKDSAIAKLAALGLTEDEAKAIIG